MDIALYILAGLLTAGMCTWIGTGIGAQRIADRIFAASDTVIKRHGKKKDTTYSKAYQELFREMEDALARKGPK